MLRGRRGWDESRVTAYYNEWEPYAAQWLRNLIAAGHIPAGDVDERSITDVSADDLVGYRQCHFFAGIGGWSLALRLAGWPDDREVWTGSCPCQPFSAAGKRAGVKDERHLWPEFHRLIAQRRPAIVFGEQVASKDGLEWFDLVRADLEAAGYAAAAADLCAAGVGAPHIRQRLWWVADARRAVGERWPHTEGLDADYSGKRSEGSSHNQPCGSSGRLADLHGYRRDQAGPSLAEAGRDGLVGDGSAGRLADAQQYHRGRQAKPADHVGPEADRSSDQHGGRGGASMRLANATEQRWESDAGSDSGVREGAIVTEPDRVLAVERPGPTNGFWRDADWLYCRDGKWRPVEPGAQPLAHGVSNRVGRLRAYGNAIPPHVAAQWIGAVMECRP